MYQGLLLLVKHVLWMEVLPATHLRLPQGYNNLNILDYIKFLQTQDFQVQVLRLSWSLGATTQPKVKGWRLLQTSVVHMFTNHLLGSPKTQGFYSDLLSIVWSWKHFCTFLSLPKSYGLILVSNPECHPDVLVLVGWGNKTGVHCSQWWMVFGPAMFTEQLSPWTMDHGSTGFTSEHFEGSKLLTFACFDKTTTAI